MLEEMRCLRLEPNVTSYKAAIRAHVQYGGFLVLKVLAETGGARTTGVPSKRGVRQSVLCYRVATRTKLAE